MAQTVTDFLQLLGDKATNLYANLSQDQLNTVLANAYDNNDTATINAIKQANPQGYNAFVDAGYLESDDPAVNARNEGLRASADKAAESASAWNEANMENYQNAVDEGDYSTVYKNATDSNVGWSDYLNQIGDTDTAALKYEMTQAAKNGEIAGYAGEGNSAAYQAAYENLLNDDYYNQKVKTLGLGGDISYMGGDQSAANSWYMTILDQLASAYYKGDMDSVQDKLTQLKAAGYDISGFDTSSNLESALEGLYKDEQSRYTYGVTNQWDSLLSAEGSNGASATADEAKTVFKTLGLNLNDLSDQSKVNKLVEQYLSQGDEATAAAIVRTAAAYTDDPSAYISQYTKENLANTYEGGLSYGNAIHGTGLGNNISADWSDLVNAYSNGTNKWTDSSATYEPGETYATENSIDNLFNTANNGEAQEEYGNGVNPTTTTTPTNGDETGTGHSKLSYKNTSGSSGDDDSEGSIFSNADEVNKILTEGTQAAQKTYGEQTATALQPITEAKDAYNYTDQLDNYNQDWENYKEQTASNNAYLDTQKDAAQNWETYMNPLTEYLNKQIAANYRDTAGSQGSSGSVLEAKNKAIADNTAAQYQNAVNTAITNSQNNQNIANSQQNNADSYLSGANQTLTNNVTPTTDWTAYMTDYADTNLNANNNLVNAQAQIASQEPTTWDNISDVVSAGVSILTPILSALKS